MTISYCTKCGKESCQHGGWTSRGDEALMRRALEIFEGLERSGMYVNPWREKARDLITALNERLLSE